MFGLRGLVFSIRIHLHMYWWIVVDYEVVPRDEFSMIYCCRYMKVLIFLGICGTYRPFFKTKKNWDRLVGLFSSYIVALSRNEEMLRVIIS